MKQSLIIAIILLAWISYAGLAQTDTTKVEKRFTEENVTFKNDTISFGGTLTIPDTPGPHPAVVMVTGSGIQDRDETIFGFKVFKVLAEHLSNNGIAVLRYDDRGIGESKADVKECTTEDFAGDAWAAYEYLTSRDEIDKNAAGILGHSEGGVIAMQLAAKHKDIGFLVLLAPSTIRGADVINSQIIVMHKSVGKSQDYIDRVINLQEAIYKAIITGEGMDDAKSLMVDFIVEEIEKLPEDQKKMVKNPREYAEYQADVQLQSAKTNWFKYYIQYDPMQAIEKISCPVLTLFAELDMQVLPTINKGPLEKGLKKAPTDDYDIVIIKEANHLFQRAITGSVNEYSTLQKKFQDGVPEKISGWINERFEK